MGVDAKDYDAIALKEHLTPLELELRKLEDAVTAINKHMTYMKQRESAMRDTNGLFLSSFIMTDLIYLFALELIVIFAILFSTKNNRV